MVKHAKTAEGLWGNIKFIVRHKALATLVVFLWGTVAGIALCQVAG